MKNFDIFFIALGLAMDAFAIAIAIGGTICGNGIKEALIVGLSFGLFQAIMPVVGWLAGRTVAQYISMFDHWVVFGILAFIGVKMIIESFQLQKENKISFCTRTIVLLSFATSIDALAVGLTFSFLRISIILTVFIIGVVTFFLSTTGVLFGVKTRHLYEEKFEFAGGLLLVGIGLKILLEHLGVL